MLRWRLLGIHFCIQPSFWFMNALWVFLLVGPLSGRPMDKIPASELLKFGMA